MQVRALATLPTFVMPIFRVHQQTEEYVRGHALRGRLLLCQACCWCMTWISQHAERHQYFECRLNRAACHLKMDCSDSCTEDCDYVIDRLQRAETAVQEGRHNDIDTWRRMFVKAHVRRASALAKIGAFCCFACTAGRSACSGISYNCAAS